MNGSRTRWWSIVAAMSLALTLFTAPASASAQSLGQQGANWWLWALQFTNSESPITDTTGARCASEQSGSVWYLAGSGGPDSVERDCTVPFGKTLFFPLITVECSNLEVDTIFFGRTPKQRRDCAVGFVDGVSASSVKLTVTKAGQQQGSTSSRAVTPDFHFTDLPPTDNFLGVTCSPPNCQGDATADGYWASIPALARGRYDIHFEAAITSGPLAGFSQNVTYHLTVR